jgi:hypothetical protein
MSSFGTHSGGRIFPPVRLRGWNFQDQIRRLTRAPPKKGANLRILDALGREIHSQKSFGREKKISVCGFGDAPVV